MARYSPMRPNPNSAAARGQSAPRRPSRSPAERAATPPAGWEVALRPFGYLSVAIVWAAIFAATLALPALLPLGVLADGSDFTTASFISGMDPIVGILFVLICLVLLVPILGYAFLALPLASGPLMMLALTYVVRSLLPAYRTTRLSATGWSRSALGPFTAFPAALSLIPIASTRWSRFWLGAALLGWLPSLGMLISAYVFGVGYFVTISWLLWPLHSTAAIVVWSVVSAVFAVATVVLLVREALRRFSPRQAAGRGR